MTVTSSENGGEVTIHKDNVLVVKLSAQLGTGYSWHVSKKDDSKLKQLGEPVTEEVKDKDGGPEKGKDGGPEIEVFRFKPLKEGTEHLEFRYQRPFSDDPQHSEKAKKRFRIKVIIKD